MILLYKRNERRKKKACSSVLGYMKTQISVRSLRHLGNDLMHDARIQYTQQLLQSIDLTDNNMQMQYKCHEVCPNEKKEKINTSDGVVKIQDFRPKYQFKESPVPTTLCNTTNTLNFRQSTSLLVQQYHKRTSKIERMEKKKLYADTLLDG
jgi:hypothetical protein